MNIYKKPVWNGLISGSYTKIVQLLENDLNGQDKWAVVFELSKIEPFKIWPNIFEERESKYCFMIFKFKSKINLYEEGFREEYFEKILIEYFEDIESLLTYLVNVKIDLDLFVPVWKTEFPMGG